MQPPKCIGIRNWIFVSRFSSLCNIPNTYAQKLKLISGGEGTRNPILGTQNQPKNGLKSS